MGAAGSRTGGAVEGADRGSAVGGNWWADASRAQAVFGGGAASCAVVTDIVQATDPQARCAEWLDLAQEAAR